jgi:hypothetical protein
MSEPALDVEDGEASVEHESMAPESSIATCSPLGCRTETHRACAKFITLRR